MKANQLNIAATCPATRALGPGLRAVVWVQGCVFQCPGCIAPDWIPIKPALLVSPIALAGQLVSNPAITGLTISGGEPMIQAEGLVRMICEARRIRPELDVICFTGFHLEQLRKAPPGPGVNDLLTSIDALIDGPYIHRLNDDLGLRGSRNQRIHYFSDRLLTQDLDGAPRNTEIMVQEGSAFLVGVPTRKILDGFSLAMQQVQDMAMGGPLYERT
jgi:anaerobic ribonucleoside-triphosphate reductase activating protein